MVEVTISPQTYARISEAQRKALLRTGERYRDLVKDKMKKEDGIDTGKMVNSIYVRIEDGGANVQVGSDLIQANVLETGRRPGAKRPPMNALVGWAGRKGIVASGALNVEDLSTADRGIIYVMARAIGEKGIRARKYFERTMKDNRKKLVNFYNYTFNFLARGK